MDWVLLGSIKARDLPAAVPLSLALPPSSSPPPPSPPLSAGGFANKMISPSVLLIIVILAIIFISGLLHLLIRYLLRPSNREPDESTENVTILQGQLQQLFNLHDAGVDQSFIDTLPVFLYKAIIGLKDPFDCAVCLCEFEPDDKLRLLPKCSHAFHLECIDTWLLSHSTCPLCRRSLLPDFSPTNSCSPLVLVLESGSESSREIASERGDFAANGNSYAGDDETSQKSAEVAAKEETNVRVSEAEVEGKVVTVKLGKFRSIEDNGGGGGEGTSNGTSNLDQRRCFSMGSYEYVMNETASLQVAIKPPKKKPAINRRGYRQAMSECDFHSQREGFKGFDTTRRPEFGADHGGVVGNNIQKKESFSISKTWQRGAHDDPVLRGSSRRAFSFRLPLSRPPANETGDFKSENCRSEFDVDVEIGSCSNSMISRTDETPSFARRTLLWLVGKQNRVGSQL